MPQDGSAVLHHQEQSQAGASGPQEDLYFCCFHPSEPVSIVCADLIRFSGESKLPMSTDGRADGEQTGVSSLK